MAQMTTDLCEERSGAIKSDVAEIKVMLSEIYSLLKGNGKPGLRETQAELAAHIAEGEKSKESWASFIIKPVIEFVVIVASGMIVAWLLKG